MILCVYFQQVSEVQLGIKNLDTNQWQEDTRSWGFDHEHRGLDLTCSAGCYVEELI